MNNPFSLRSEMGVRRRVFFLLVVVFVPLLFLQGFTFYKWYRERKEAEIQANLELARTVSKTFDAFIKDVLHTQLAIGLAATASPPPSNDSLRRILEAAEGENLMANSFSWISPAGVILASSNPALRNRKIERGHLFSRIVSGEEHGISDLQGSPYIGEKVFAIGRGIRDPEGNLLGVVSCVCSADKLNHLLAVQRSKHAGINLTDSKGISVYRYPAFRELTPEQANWLKRFPMIQHALEGKETTGSITGPKDEIRLAAFVPVPSIGWVAGSSRPKHEVIGSITRTLLPHAVVILLVTLAAFVAALALSRPISISIRRLQDHAASFGKGEVERFETVHGPLEIKSLFESFNDMAETIRSREGALRESEQKFRALFENSPEAVFLTGPDGSVAAANPAACTMLGFSEEEIRRLGRSGVLDLENPRLSAGLEERRRTGHVKSRELTAIRKGGERFPVEVDSVILPGEPVQSFVIMRDISERKRVERSLREREEASRHSLAQLRSVLNLMSEGVLILDGKGRFLLVNPAMIRLAGWDEAPKTWKEYMGRIEMRDLSGQVLPFEQWPASRALRGESIRDLEYEVHRFDTGKDYIALYSGTPAFNDEGGVELVVVTVRDITARKRDEEELHKAKEELERRVRERTAELELRNRELQDFTFAAAHDLQEPLRKIQVFSDLFAAKCFDSVSGQGRDYIKRMHDTATRMRQVLHSLMKYSRLTITTEPFARVDLNKIAREAVSDLELQIRDTGAVVEIGELPEVTADAAQMRQLFQNLLGNGLKFRREGIQPTVSIQADCSPQNDQCEIRFNDNGIGFEEKYLDRIFKPFHRLHGKDEYDGVGMGLAICSKVIEHHRGTITAKSTSGKGSTFIVTLPWHLK